MALVGAQLTLQAPVNRGLSRSIGPIGAAFVSYLVGCVVLGIACAAGGELGGLGRVEPHWWMAFSGFLGAFYVLSALVVVRSIGAGGLVAGTVTGQLTTSVLIDTYGWFGIEQRPFELRVLLGGAGVVAGTYLVAGVRHRRVDGGGPTATLVPLLVIVVTSAMIGIQNPLNTEIAKSTGDLASAFLTFLSGGLLIGLFLVATRSVGRLRLLPNARPYELTGGIFGAVSAFASLALIGSFGAGLVVAANTTGQMLTSLAVDRFGLFGLEPRPLQGRRLFGGALLVLGTVLVAR
jgi:bacterial/archaeal transporter family-2 protein